MSAGTTSARLRGRRTSRALCGIYGRASRSLPRSTPAHTKQRSRRWRRVGSGPLLLRPIRAAERKPGRRGSVGDNGEATAAGDASAEIRPKHNRSAPRPRLPLLPFGRLLRVGGPGKRRGFDDWLVADRGRERGRRACKVTRCEQTAVVALSASCLVGGDGKLARGALDRGPADGHFRSSRSLAPNSCFCPTKVARGRRIETARFLFVPCCERRPVAL